MPTTNLEVAVGFQSNLFDFLAFYRGIKLGGRNTRMLMNSWSWVGPDPGGAAGIAHSCYIWSICRQQGA